MFQGLREQVAGWLVARLRKLPALWRENPPGLPEATHGLQIPLRPSPAVRRGRWLIHALMGIYLVQLLLLDHFVVGAMVALLAAASGWQCRGRNSPVTTAQRLLLSADGRVHLLEAGGRVVAAVLHPSSMRLGPWLLLVLQVETGTRRLLLGPDNVAPGQLAALRRRVAAIPQR